MKSWPLIKTHYFKHIATGRMTETRNPIIAAVLAANKNFKYLYSAKSYVVETEKTIGAGQFAQYPYSEKQKAQDVPSKQGAVDVIVLVLIFVLCAMA